LVGWAARQIAANPWRVAGIFNGRLRSLLIASAWLFLGMAPSGFLSIGCRWKDSPG
jgi:hypothetical protein